MEVASVTEGTAGVPPSATMAEVHAAWLAAGARSDVAAMRQLLNRFPEWIDLQRQVGPATSNSTPTRQANFCSWSDFHLRTLGASAIHTAAWEGNVDIMQFVLEAGQSPDTGDDSAMTPMMLSILRLNLMTMRCVFVGGEAVRRNLVVDCRKDEDERRAKIIAVIKLLLRFGADIESRSQDGKSALHCSTSDDAFEVAEFLLDAGASMDVQDDTGKTPLHYCVQEGGLLVTDLLLSRGANIDVVDADGVTPLTLMLQRANLNVVQIFLNHHSLVSTRQRLDFAGTLLLQAVDNQAEEVVRFIVENEYASVTVTNAAGETPLHRAILKSCHAMIELLADLDPAGDSLTAVTEKAETPSHYAARYGSSRVVEMLLRCVARVFGDLQELGTANPLNAVDENGETALYLTGTALYSSDSRQDKVEGETCNGSLMDRDVKAQLLLHHGARIFPTDLLTRALADNHSVSDLEASRVTLPVQVQRCLCLWLVEDRVCADEPPEDGDTARQTVQVAAMEALTELCMQWVASVACVGPCASFPSILICAGYAHEMVPLLVELPLHRSSLPAVLRQLEKFARRHLCRALVLQLHDELLEVWREIPQRRV